MFIILPIAQCAMIQFIAGTCETQIQAVQCAMIQFVLVQCAMIQTCETQIEADYQSRHN